jgi:hypothetical protein
VNVTPVETRNFYALVTLGLNPDGTTAEHKEYVASAPPSIISAPSRTAKEKETA